MLWIHITYPHNPCRGWRKTIGSPIETVRLAKAYHGPQLTVKCANKQRERFHRLRDFKQNYFNSILPNSHTQKTSWASIAKRGGEGVARSDVWNYSSRWLRPSLTAWRKELFAPLPLAARAPLPVSTIMAVTREQSPPVPKSIHCQYDTIHRVIRQSMCFGLVCCMCVMRLCMILSPPPPRGASQV